MSYDKNYQELANAIIIYAADDFRSAYRRYLVMPKDAKTKAEIRKLKRFFLSDYFKILTKLDGENLMESLMKEIKENPNQPIRRKSIGKIWKGRKNENY